MSSEEGRRRMGRGGAVVAGVVALAVAVAVVLGVFWAQAPVATPVGVGETLPAIALPFAASDATLPLPELKGHPLLVVFVSTSSPGEQQFVRQLEAFHRRYLRRGLNLVGIALDDDRAALQRFLEKEAITFTMLHDSSGLRTSGTFGHSQPRDAYLLGPEGKVGKVFTGSEPWQKQLVTVAVRDGLRR